MSGFFVSSPRLAVFLTALLLIGSEAGAQEPRDRFVGCYSIEIGEWEPDYDPDRQPLPIPIVIRPTVDLNAGPRGGRHSRAVEVLEARDGAWPSADSDLMQTWTVQGDTIVVHLSGSLGGYQLVLEAAGEDGVRRIEGTIFAWDEYENPHGERDPEPGASVRLRPVDCLARPGREAPPRDTVEPR